MNELFFYLVFVILSFICKTAAYFPVFTKLKYLPNKEDVIDSLYCSYENMKCGLWVDTELTLSDTFGNLGVLFIVIYHFQLLL